MKYWVLKLTSGDDGVYLSALPEDGPDDYEYSEGISLIDRHPVNEDTDMYYDPGYPDGIKLYDFVDNLDGVLIGNQKVIEVLEGLELTNIEYLPVWLMNHKNQLASKDYAIINVLGGVDIIDMEKSNVRMGAIIEDQVERIKNLVVDYKNIPENTKLFRASYKLNEHFIRDDIKQAFEEAGLTGYRDRVIPAEGCDSRD